VIFINIETRASGEFLPVLRAWEFREYLVDFNHSRESKFNFEACYCETTGFSISFIFPLLYVKNSSDRARDSHAETAGYVEWSRFTINPARWRSTRLFY